MCATQKISVTTQFFLAAPALKTFNPNLSHSHTPCCWSASISSIDMSATQSTDILSHVHIVNSAVFRIAADVDFNIGPELHCLFVRTQTSVFKRNSCVPSVCVCVCVCVCVWECMCFGGPHVYAFTCTCMTVILCTCLSRPDICLHGLSMGLSITLCVPAVFIYSCISSRANYWWQRLRNLLLNCISNVVIVWGLGEVCRA